MNHMDSHFYAGLPCKGTYGALVHLSTIYTMPHGLAEAGG